MHVSNLFPVKRLQELIEDGLVNQTKHPDLDLWIYNYSKQCQFKQAFNDVTNQCRGLILDEENNVIARPFPRFENIENRSRSDIIWKRPFQIFEKLDGSLGILYPTGDEGFAIATRGSFASDQAIRATDIYKDRYSEWEPPQGYTCLVEIVYPANRIVVNYGDVEDLFFLAAVHIDTGANLFGDQIDWPGPTAQRYDAGDIHPRDLKDKLALGDNNEGFVLYFPHANERVKVKYDNYVRLHRIVTNTSSRTVWEHLSEGRGLDDLIENVPDEFFTWLQKMAFSLQEDYDSIWNKTVDDYYEILDSLFPGMGVLFQEETARHERRTFALAAYKTKFPDLMFKMLDNKKSRIVKSIWELVKPSYERPFSQDLDTT